MGNLVAEEWRVRQRSTHVVLAIRRMGPSLGTGKGIALAAVGFWFLTTVRCSRSACGKEIPYMATRGSSPNRR